LTCSGKRCFIKFHNVSTDWFSSYF